MDKPNTPVHTLLPPTCLDVNHLIPQPALGLEQTGTMGLLLVGVVRRMA